MLTSLEIKDYALIENIKVEFNSGLNIITGETGAGKSILIGALGLLLGERASSETVRKGAQKSFVEGIFDIGENEKVKHFLVENEFEITEELIVRREISLKGSNRCFINDSPVQLSQIKLVGDLLIDLHGQHDHQSLLRVDTHIELLDEFCEINNELADYVTSKKELFSAIGEIEKLRKNEKNLKDKLELNSFQLKEINAVSPELDEDVKLEKDLNILENSENLFDTSSQIYSAIYEDENCAYDLLVNIQNRINSISRIDDSLMAKKDEVGTALELIKDVGDFIRDYKDKIEIDPTVIEEQRARLGAIQLLKKKYGGSLKNILEFKEKIEDELSLAENFSDKIIEFERKIENLRTKVKHAALGLSTKRKKEAKSINKLIEESLDYLGINDSKFEIRFDYEENRSSQYFVEIDKQKLALYPNGIDLVEFYISTNKGEDLKSLAKTASGGEISRIMLAIKSVMAKNEKLPLLVFDEIDTGVSGRIAQKVGKVLQQLSSSHQIISITHLPQIAAFAHHHYSVQKVTTNGRAISLINKLEGDDRIVEIAKLISGENVTKSNLDTAKELMTISN